MHNKWSEKIIINSSWYLLLESSKMYFKEVRVDCLYYGTISCVYRIYYRVDYTFHCRISRVFNHGCESKLYILW